eukprot:CAMPEP_0202421146 /NCGR_PEP_ID=MMETSP1128-20130828/50184_1 /ASSEMBLY_ACC=CAM_ASM_000463 /TAXON_ID=3047 /ORGANISM="Dunaliella tertiolecta, Strain CCMP1320" /LENGTH=164 /DNA_ID=CAMNT_0049029151 /DNA_START=2135 /DNA_END=2630 /DNA_ORIENTATION=+
MPAVLDSAHEDHSLAVLDSGGHQLPWVHVSKGIWALINLATTAAKARQMLQGPLAVLPLLLLVLGVMKDVSALEYPGQTVEQVSRLFDQLLSSIQFFQRLPEHVSHDENVVWAQEGHPALPFRLVTGAATGQPSCTTELSALEVSAVNMGQAPEAMAELLLARL